ncbi:AmmeMemoRadiSam system protein B [candidate division CPR3 bacterium GWF2_35_18]|uniref:MEMO1 family protein UR67_C0001G0280 n=1 Tax=candidate division CPR3 bacterium GW2011_GWF2_35_18 TaxID=1618350 RepID=A0A0G0C2P0_UNCC3|nr:MAG: AMMECR1 domain-containing protein [candidate division CPR3 bacterium GW2011_GWF2_35_18]KKP86473.1 MAG: AMMECR1 domain-containing protein [candidate division CPR3 bacterium GW2011_GWE2_35_7]OGB63580.1 MAG: AmmeMemoRadiSam system protein B [candidate division CPR3 bacterium GWF2_35_18]OGB64689.1 MAG: AmmeMemoRadiSam system protein B [candidate division CPR3 bacterium RIFOXYA2_FULL_35_13]OGB77172.1 MAG: AmmeMemoRadiSam system protein B [candidate division CPR3 bacterium RIFOXYC2_FULL_35_7]
MNIRQPFFAGSFYPDNPNILKGKIELFLNNGISSKDNILPKILLVPHAGYDYSGSVAAYAYQTLNNLTVKRVILIGCSHQSYFDGAAVWIRGHWRTPLGDIAVDEKLSQSLIDSKYIREDFKAHLDEHTLEVQIPFLQVVIKNSFTITPIILGKMNELEIIRFCAKIEENMNSETVVILSSDLSHYLSYDVANKIDEMTVKAVLSNEIERLEEVVNKNMQQGFKNLATCACGQQAIEVGMTIAKDLKLKGELLKYANSGDVMEDKHQVVGYAAIAWS